MNSSLLFDLGTALTAGLLGSIHCAGMCGPLASLGCRSQFAARDSSDWKQKLWPVLFVSGKFIAYSILGLLAGSTGGAFIKSAESSHTIAVISIITAILMVAVVMVSRIRPTFLGKPLTIIAGSLTKIGLTLGWKAPLLIGMGASLIPCGLLYAMVVRSAVAGDPIQSMMVMQAFGIGTSPVLIGLGSMMAWLPKRVAKFGNLAGEAVLLLSAGILIWRGIIGLQADPVAACCGTPH